MAEESKRIKHIVQRGKAFERQIESLKTYLDAESPDPVNAQLRSTNLTASFKEYSRYNDKLTLLQADHPQLDVFHDIESKYYDIAARVNKLQGTEPPANSTQINTTNLTFTEQYHLPKLPEIQIPTFKGDHEEWVTWKHSYLALVHERPNTSNYVKHSLLVKALSGLAYGIVKHIPPSEASYPLAWKALCDAYDQKRIIVAEHIDALLDLPRLSEAREADLSDLINKARQHVSMLKQMDVVVNEEFVIRIVERCLPKSVVARWQDRLQGNKLPKLDELFSFVQDTVFRLHQLGKLPSNSRSSKKRTGDKIYPYQGKASKTDARSFVTTASESHNSPMVCLKCNEGHRLFKCPTFGELKVQERWDFVKKGKLCRNCLYVHPFPCRSEKRCKTCGKDHHTLLHAEKRSNDRVTKTENPQNRKEAKAFTPSTSQP